MSNVRDDGKRAEIAKLPRSTCAHCGIEGPKPMVDKGRCVNQVACEKRFERKVRRRDEKGGGGQ